MIRVPKAWVRVSYELVCREVKEVDIPLYEDVNLTDSTSLEQTCQETALGLSGTILSDNNLQPSLDLVFKKPTLRLIYLADAQGNPDTTKPHYFHEPLQINFSVDQLEAFANQYKSNPHT